MFAKKLAKLLLLAALAVMLNGCGGAPQPETFPEVETRTPIVLETAAAAEPEQLPDRTGDSRQMMYQDAMDDLDRGDEMEACKKLLQIRDYQDVSVILHEIVNRRARENAQTFGYSYVIFNDGTVDIGEVYVRNDAGEYVLVENPDWKDIVAVIPDSEAGVVGLQGDGTIICTNPDSDAGRTMSQWTDLVAIYYYSGEVLGLRVDGTVLSTYEDPGIESWEDVQQISVGGFAAYALKKDGTAVTDCGYDVSGWTDLIQVSAGLDCVAGLRADGTVVAAGYDDTMQQAVAGWTDIVAVDVYNDAMGLRSNGTVVATNLFFGDFFDVEPNFSSWNNVVAIDTWGASYIGLRSDGTVLAEGLDEGGQLNVGHWRNIKAVVVDSYTTFGLTEDGTLLKTVAEYLEDEEFIASGVRCPGE